MRILTVNAGSSSVKAALAEDDHPLKEGQVAGVGSRPALVLGEERRSLPRETDAVEAAFLLTDELLGKGAPDAVAHRIVHGGKRTGPGYLDEEEIEKLEALSPLAPLHQPFGLSIAKAFTRRYRDAAQIGCFDTAFHATVPEAGRLIPVADDLLGPDLRRYGFHGLSYDGIARWAKAERPDLRSIVAAHLGAGASLCAMRDGESAGTSMGLTPLDGLPMATRSGSVDPGLIFHLLRQGTKRDMLEDALYRRSGLLALSGGLSGDMRELRSSTRPEAARAIDVFAERVAEGVAAMAVAAGGIDALVFTGGIGENDDALRQDVVRRLKPLFGSLEVIVRKANEEEVMAAQARAVLET